MKYRSHITGFFPVILMCSIFFRCTFLNPDVEGTSTFTMHSTVNDSTYQIYLYLPDGYSQNRKYGVLYILDADNQFYTVADIVKRYSDENRIDPVMVVGIGYGNDKNNRRVLDYTPTTDTSYCVSGIKGDGAEKFLQFLTDELIPYIDNKYSTAGDSLRFLGGHSLGGLFSLYCFLTNPDLFNGYLAATASIWWNNGILFKYEQELSIGPIVRNNTKLYMSIGSGGDGTGGMEIVYLKELQKRIESHSDSLISIRFDMYNNDYHSYNWITAYDRGLPYVIKR